MTYLPGESAVARLMRLRRAALLAREAGQIEEMTRAWLDVEQALDSLISDLVNQIEALVQAGTPPTQGQLFRLARYHELLVQAEIEIAKYVTGYLSPQLIEWQEEMIRLGLRDAIEAIEVSYLSAGMFGVNFNRLPVSAVELLVGLAGDGSPLLELLKSRVIGGPEFAVKVMETLIRAVALGWNPRKTARMIKDALTGGLNKALQIARTEQLRVMRAASLMQYRESGVVEKYMRLSAKDHLVCPACLFADGRIYDLDVEFEEHPQGRCVPVPVVIGTPLPVWLTGTEWFLQQSPQIQVMILGPGRYEAWKKGLFKLEDLITRRYNKIWGNSLIPTPLKELVEVD